MLKNINLKKLTAKTVIGILMVGGLIAPAATKKAVASNGVQGLELNYYDSAFSCSGTQADIKVKVYAPSGELLTTMSKGDTYTTPNYDSVDDLQFRYHFSNFSSSNYCYNGSDLYEAVESRTLASGDSIPNLGGYGSQTSISEMLDGLDNYEELHLVELWSTSGTPYDLQDVVLVVDNNPESLVGEEDDDDSEGEEDTQAENPSGDGDDSTVSLELVLSVDVSGSVSGNHNNANGEYRKQIDGYIAAFNDPDVQNAIKSLDDGMAVTMQFWADQNVADIGWYTITKDGENLVGIEEFTNAIQAVRRNKNQKKVKIGDTWTTLGSGTDIKMAIDEAVDLLENNEYTGDSLVIDVSGDGIPDDTPFAEATKSLEYGYKNGECGYTFDCPPVVNARDAAVEKGITINGLPINNASASTKDGTDINGDAYSVSNLADRVDEYYMSQVAGGTNSFTLLADGFDDFSRAARIKILKEISDTLPEEEFGCDAEDGCESPNTVPVANDDTYEVVTNTSNTFDVTSNDTDADGDSLVINGVEIADDAGSIEIVNNQLVYTAPETAGTYTFIYEVYDGKGGVDTAEVEVEVVERYAD